MSDLIRPEPPREWRDRVASVTSRLGAGRVAAGVVTVVATAAAATWLLRAPAPPLEASLPPAQPVASAVVASTVGATATTTPADVVVQAAGAVARPGVYRFPAGARVADVVAAAGGVTADADPGAVLLAAVVSDGERVYVPRVGEAVPPPAVGPAGGDATSGSDGPSGPVNLNTATAGDLDALPGVGPATAAAIVAHRDANGPFASVDELVDVKGIGPAKLEALRPLVAV